MSMMPSYGKLVAKDPEACGAENYQPPVLCYMMDINFIASYSASEGGIIYSMTGCIIIVGC